MSNHKLPTIALVGRRNVGKSALFNRLIEEQKAIVSDIPGTTRDRTEGLCCWRGENIRIVDTGGMDVGEEETIDREVKEQARFAIKAADLIVFLVDARVGPAAADTTLARELRKSKKPILLVANKAETAAWREQAEHPSWKRLGFGASFPIAALTGQGVGDLLDTIFKKLKIKASRLPVTNQRSDLRVAIIGKPNVGKSSLLNKILGEKRVIVSPTPHTTREPQDTLLTIEAVPPSNRRSGLQISKQQTNVLLIDTAGIRRNAKIKAGIEQLGVKKTIVVIERAQVVIFVVDSTQPLEVQDKHLAGFLVEKGVGVVVAANKWDLLERSDTKSGNELKATIHQTLPGIDFAPVLFISAANGHNVQKLLPLVLAANENRNRVIDDEALEKLLPKMIKRHRPPRERGDTRHPVIRRIEQIGAAPPRFVVLIGPKQSLHESYLRFVENQLRRYFEFEGTPIRVEVRQENK